jgi:hypothetical protein
MAILNWLYGSMIHMVNIHKMNMSNTYHYLFSMKNGYKTEIFYSLTSGNDNTGTLLYLLSMDGLQI